MTARPPDRLAPHRASQRRLEQRAGPSAPEHLAEATSKTIVLAVDAARHELTEHVAAAVQMVKEAVNRAYETTLAEGLHFERRLFHAMFATADQKEGMAAFAEKRKPAFKDE